MFSRLALWRPQAPPIFLTFLLLLAPALVGCGGASDSSGGEHGGSRPGKAERGAGERSAGERSGGERGGRDGRPARGGGPPEGVGGADGASRGVPVETTEVGRRPIALFFETNGALEAENEVDLVARASGPIVELATEEGKQVSKGTLLARLDDQEIRAQIEAVNVRLEETRKTYERVRTLHEKELVSQDSYDQALANFESAKAESETLQVQLGYTRIRAPFSGLVVERYVRFAEFVQSGARLFRLSDFDPLLCPIQVPERELARLRVGQAAEIEVEAYGQSRFRAKVARSSPVVDAETGTVKVTLQVFGEGKLRPGMFAKVFLEMESRSNALVIPKSALALDSLGNTVFVAGADGNAERRDLELGFRNDNLLEVLSGLEEGEPVVVVGQDGLSDGTPIEILGTRPLPQRPGQPAADGAPTEASARDGDRAPSARPDGAARRGGGRGGPMADIDLDDPEQVEKVRTFLRQRGLTEEEVEQRLERMRQRRGEAGGSGGS